MSSIFSVKERVLNFQCRTHNSAPLNYLRNDYLALNLRTDSDVLEKLTSKCSLQFQQYLNSMELIHPVCSLTSLMTPSCVNLSNSAL